MSGEENLATEALCFILSQSAPARRAFVVLLSRILGRQLPDLTFRTQAADPDGTIPDLAGVDGNGRAVVYVEAKFWAGLTKSQPVGYLRRLQREGGLGLVMVAPANRRETLWPELVRLCQHPDVEMTVDTDTEGERSRLVGAFAAPFALTSWTAVLAELLHATSTAGDTPASEDIRQLRGLCDTMETAGFLPLRSEELTGNAARRVEDYCGLADDITAVLVAEDIVSIKGARATASRDFYGRYMSFKGHGGLIAYHSGWWARIYPTPLWLRIFGPDAAAMAGIRGALASWMASQPPRAFVAPDGAVLIPLLLPTGSERHVVLGQLVDQVRTVSSAIPSGPGHVAAPGVEGGGESAEASADSEAPDGIVEAP